MIESNKIKELARDIWPVVQSYRHHLHKNPELSFEEFNTAKFIESKLSEFAGENRIYRLANTGIVYEITGKNPGRTIALRADIDALPILEKNDKPYRSQNDGVMHACGHDVHTSCMLGAAQLLTELSDYFDGTVKIIFQPAEEKIPGGASLMIKEGVLKNPAPTSIIGQHVMPLIPAGKVGFRSGKYMASADEIYLTVKGKGGHAAMPENLVDPILIAAQLITALQQIVSRKASPKMPSVLSFGRIEGLGATNVIPETVALQGTFRTLNEEWRFEAHDWIRKICKNISQAAGGDCDVDIKVGYPYLSNDPELTAKSMEAAKNFLGDENVVDLDIWMAAEDFAYYSQEIPACFYRLGTRNESEGITSGVHTATFDIDESSMEIGVGLMTWLALEELRS